MNPRTTLRYIAAIIGLAISFLAPSETRAQKSIVAPSSENLSGQPDLFEVSLGYNYIHLGDTSLESKSLHGLDVSAFINLNSWLALGGDFMADFGHRTQNFFFANVDIDNQRYVYVFGPRVTVWRNPQFKVFVEALAGGVSADVQASVGSLSQSASDNGFAMATGAGFDWRFSRHFSWRVVQGDYLPTHLGSQWQNNFRLSSGIVYSFGGR
jgi:hypothetical protein